MTVSAKLISAAGRLAGATRSRVENNALTGATIATQSVTLVSHREISGPLQAVGECKAGSHFLCIFQMQPATQLATQPLAFCSCRILVLTDGFQVENNAMRALNATLSKYCVLSYSIC